MFSQNRRKKNNTVGDYAGVKLLGIRVAVLCKALPPEQ